VIGVVEDFHFRSLHEQIGPVVLGYRNNPVQSIDYFTLRVATDDLPATLAGLRAVHEQFDTVTPFEYNFLDERLADAYEDDQRAGTIFGVVAALAIFIACCGLFGLAAFMAEQRTKEIGVRKVMGASVGSIVLLLSKDFTRLVLLAFVLGAPVAYVVTNRWLGGFAYHLEVGVWTLVLAGAGALAIACLTVSYQSVKAAVSDPVKVLRYE
jgi:putative ABC transport system permease protein